jgi:hypothetical protein
MASAEKGDIADGKGHSRRNNKEAGFMISGEDGGDICGEEFCVPRDHQRLGKSENLGAIQAESTSIGDGRAEIFLRAISDGNLSLESWNRSHEDREKGREALDF